MDNWKDYVGFQPVVGVDDKCGGAMAFYIRCVEVDVGGIARTISMSVMKEVVPLDRHIHNDDDIGYAVELAINRFSEVVDTRMNYDHLTFWDHCKRVWWEWRYFKLRGCPVPNPWFNRAALDVAVKTRRGVANTNFKDVWFYNGKSAFDRPIIVTEINGKYAITMPLENFQDYGFRVIK